MAYLKVVLNGDDNNKIEMKTTAESGDLHLIYLIGINNYILSAHFGSFALEVMTGKMWAWGYSYQGELGNNSTNVYSVPITVCGNHFFTYISGPRGIDSNNKLWAWGNNSYGELGKGTQDLVVGTCTPIAVCGNHTFCQIFCGDYQNLAIDNHNRTWGWGGNTYGVLAVNNTNNYCTPIAIYGNHTFCKICVRWEHAVAIDNHGKAWSWGTNLSGDLGNGDMGSGKCKSTPVAVYGTHTFCDISIGVHFSTAVDNHGNAWSWGYNPQGQLGNNSINNECTPVAVCGGIIFKKLAKVCHGYYHMIALDYGGNAWGWGINGYGELGNNTTTNRSVPTLICGNHVFCEIAIGEFDAQAYSLGLESTGKVWAWGNNTFANLGNNSTTNYSTPIAVCVL